MSEGLGPPKPLDEIVASHEQAVAILKAAMVESEASASYLMLVNENLVGETERLAGVAARQAKDLWGRVDKIEARLSAIRTYLDNNGTRGRHGEQIAEMLSQGVEGSQPIAQALAEAGRRHDHIRSWAAKITETWLATIPRIDSATATLDRLDLDIKAIGGSEPLIGQARQQAVELERRLVTDPLSVPESLGDELDQAVAMAARSVAKTRSGHDNLEADMGEAAATLASVRVLRARAAALAHEVERKIAKVTGMAVPSVEILDGPGALSEQLDEIVDPDSELGWSQRRFLLDRWLETAHQLESQLERVWAHNAAPLKLRDELRGRLTAYRAKMSAVGRAEDLELAAIANSVRSELYTAPSDLQQAERELETLIYRLHHDPL